LPVLFIQIAFRDSSWAVADCKSATSKDVDCKSTTSEDMV